MPEMMHRGPAMILFKVVLVLSILGVRGDAYSNKRSIVETIKVESGDIFDCYLRDEQPTLTHPLFKDHKIQMAPTRAPSLAADSSSSHVLPLSVGCPVGTIPVRRSKEMNHQGSRLLAEAHRVDRLLAAAGTVPGVYRGVSASVGVWRFSSVVYPNQTSGAFLWVGDDSPTSQDSEFIAVGWLVSPALYNDVEPRFTAFWSGKDGKSCYNTQCPGFVHLNREMAFGTTFPSISRPYREEVLAKFEISMDLTGNWLLFLGGDTLSMGYWPWELFSKLAISAGTVAAGGFASTPFPLPGPPMGSGSLPGSLEGGRASSVRNIEIADDSGLFVNPSKWYKKYFLSNSCYKVSEVVDDYKEGLYFKYGGVGGC